MYNSIYPTYVNSYYGINNRKQITRKQDEEKNSQSSQNAENDLQQGRRQSKDNSYFPNGEKVSIDYTRRKIGIDQVLKDFKNTTNAIGASDEIKAEVASYISLIENQAQKENPNPQIIQANLKSASQILDEYITNTLKKPSKVVENWVEALFLQHIDYKTEQVQQEEIIAVESKSEEDEQIVEEQQTVQLESTEEEQVQPKVNDGVYVPLDAQLKRMFIQAKKYAAIDNKEQALYSFQNALEYADEIGDYQTSAMINYEAGRLYDDFNQIEDALYSYDRAARQSTDNNIKARAHISMGRIYDDYVNFEPAMEHYCAAVSYAGEADNLKLQTKALSDLAQLHTGKYDKQNAFMFMDMASTIADETKSEKVKGLTYSKNAKMCEKLGEKAKALNLYGNSSASFSKVEDYENLAKNYRSAAALMLQYGNSAKARKLLSKAYVAAYNTDNSNLQVQITKDLAAL